MPTVPSPEPSLAATVVLLRPSAQGPEVLLIERPSTMAFAPGLHVFPGGRVDPEDGDRELDPDEASAAFAASSLGGNLAPGEALAVHRAALRELREEAGIDLRDVTHLAPIAHWTTPRFMPRRFSTWFFVADLPPDAPAPVFAPDEVASNRWLTPDAALDALGDGEIQMWVPTTSVLERLVETRATTAAEVRARLRLDPVSPPQVLEETDVLVRIALGSAGALPGRLGQATLHGRHELVLLDPGDPSDAALDAISAAVERRAGRITAIVLSATDPDHAAGAEALAIPLDVPILVAPGAGRGLPYATREVADGERLPADVELRAVLAPMGSGRLSVVTGSAGE
jgi:8-oxo-dGTP pyrophosphatase MutT (NUDIX family)